LPEGVEQIVGDLNDDARYAELASKHFDVVCQFLAYAPERIVRDIDSFGGRCGQYIFISSASAYQKPCPVDVITEALPLDNPFWEYSRKKAACEVVLNEAAASGKFPVTIVRPSHTYRTRLPGTCQDGDHMIWRIRRGKPVIVHDHGESLWTLTHSDDFARAFVKLCLNDKALFETFHITCDQAHTWNEIVRLFGEAIGEVPQVVHVATDTLVAHNPTWLGPLKGDKANSAVFDNQKIRTATGGWRCAINLEQGFARAARFAEARLGANYQPNAALDALIDRLVEEQSRSSN